ncbi:MAG: hypothetical protein RL768_340 [Nitrospirota bacterium]|jgi:uncharacterized protein YjeT (DUF2065 family)
MKDYALAAIAGIWLADGLSLLLAPRFVVERLREVIRQQPAIWTWQWLSVVAGAVLLFTALPLRYQPLWVLTALAMLTKGLFLVLGPEKWRSRLVEWCLNREDVDYRFVGIGLCTLAALLLHALGWLGQE